MESKINQVSLKNENPKKRVLFVITRSEPGGAQRFLLEFLPRLDRQKYEAIVAAGRTDANEILTLNRLQRNPSFLFIEDWLAVFELKKLIKTVRPDILFLSSSKAGFVGSLASRLLPSALRPKVIYRIGGWTFNDPWPRWKKNFWVLLEKASARWKDFIIVNSKSDYEQALRLKIKPRRGLKLVHNGIDALKIEFLPKEEARSKFKIPQTDFVVGTIANFYKTKGLEYLVEAANTLKSLIPNSKFLILIIGDGPERPNLESRIKNYGLEKEIKLLGQIPEAREYIKAFDVFALPSVKEGFPWAVLEAMAAKLPVVATNVGALPEIIENGRSGILVEPKNPQELAEALKFLIENERKRQELGLEAHQTVLLKFPIEKMVRETEELFSDENHY